jgi:hypothetical protein
VPKPKGNPFAGIETAAARRSLRLLWIIVGHQSHQQVGVHGLEAGHLTP